MPGPSNKLPDKYIKALALIDSGDHTYREIAKLCSINEDEFYCLIEGSNTESPHIQQLFTEQLSEIQKRRDKEIRELVKKNKKETHLLINAWLLDQKKLKKVDTKLMGTVVSVANALAKSTPNVEIGSFSYTKGLSPEDIRAEFTRLRGLIAERRGVRPIETGRTGESALPMGSRGTAEEVKEDTLL